MKRREALNQVAILMGGVLSAPTLAAVLEGCRSTPSASTTEFSLSPDLKEILAELAEMIIPTSDTPGAKDAGVGPFIEVMLKDCYSDEQAASFKAGLESVAAKAKEMGNSFVKLEADKKAEILTALADEAQKEAEANEKLDKAKQIDTETGKEKKEEATKDPIAPFFKLLKELTVVGYFTSEIGQTQVLNYVPIPGRFEGCIPLEKGAKAYSFS